jgi:hypothetical protein
MVIVAARIHLGYYVLPAPPAVTFIIFFCTLTMLFYLEGLMIAKHDEVKHTERRGLLTTT